MKKEYVRCRFCDSGVSTKDVKLDNRTNDGLYRNDEGSWRCPVCNSHNRTFVFINVDYEIMPYEELGGGDMHYIEKCKKCGDVISQCKCLKCDKTVKYSLCEKCKKENDDE